MIKPRNCVKNITPYKADEYRQNCEYKLDSNENIYGCADFIYDVLKNIKKEDISLYPCYGKFLEQLKQRYKIDDVLLTNGCDEALSIIINAYLEKNDEILSYSPTFSMPHLYAKALGAKSKTFEYSKKYVFDKNDFKKNITRKTKIVYIATPNNPTGETAEALDIKELADKYKNILFIVDCTYINFSTKNKFEDYLELIKTNDNIAILKSFSKDFALAGLRLGFIASNCEIITNLKKIASPYNVNMVAINCAKEVLNHEDCFLKVKEDILKAKEILFEGLKTLGYKPYKSEANFILCDFKEHCDFVFEKLKNEGIIVRRYKKNTNLETSLRITIPTLLGVNKILELIKPKPMYVFDMDGVIFDVSKSYRQAIIKTFEHFLGYECQNSDIQNVKNLGGMSNDWKVTEYLINKAGKHPKYAEIVEVFQKFFYNPDNVGSKGLIDNEEIVFNGDFFEKLAKANNLAVFTSRDNIEAYYSLEKYDIKKYFSYFVTAEDVGKFQKPSGFGLNLIKKNCPVTDVYYFGDTIDDIKAGMEADVEVFGVIPPNASKVDDTVESLKKQGAFGIVKCPDDVLNINKKESLCL